MSREHLISQASLTASPQGEADYSLPLEGKVGAERSDEVFPNSNFQQTDKSDKKNE